MIPGKMRRGTLAVGSVQAVGGGPLLCLVLGFVLGLVLGLGLGLVNASWCAAPTKNHDYAPPPTHPLSKNPYYSCCPHASANKNQYCFQWKSS
jgi:hypothetical protein